MVGCEGTVFVVEDDGAVRKSVCMLAETVGLKTRAYDSAADFLDDYDGTQAGCLVLDVRLEGMSGLDLQSHLKKEGVEIPVIVVSGHGDVSMAVQAMKAGAVSFIEKPFRDQVLIDAVNEAMQIDSRRRCERIERVAVEAKMSGLTSREREILELMIVGKSTQAVAAALDISPKTVDFHRHHVLEKMGVGSTVELVLFCGKIQV